MRTLQEFHEAGFLSASEGTNFDIRLSRADAFALLMSGEWDERVFCREYGCDNHIEDEDGSIIYATDEAGNWNPNWPWSGLLKDDLLESGGGYALADWWETFEVRVN